MKYLNLIIILLFTQSYAQDRKNYTINGQIDGLKEGSALYLTKESSGTDTIAKANINKGRFIFKGNAINEGEIHYLKIDPLISKTAKTIFLDNADITLKGDVKNWPDGIEITGSISTNEYESLLKLLMPIYKEMMTRQKAINEKSKILSDIKKQNKIGADTLALNEEITSLRLLGKKQLEVYLNVWTSFIASHPNSIFIPFSISNLEAQLGNEGLKVAYEKLSKKSKESFYGKKLKQRIEVLLLRETIAVGKVIPDFTITSPDGAKLSIRQELSKSKVTLIDFWASWCKPCRAAVPHLKEIYNKYANQGFNIIGISSDKDINAWRKAIKDDNTLWTHGLQNADQSGERIFGLRGIPSFVLLDENGIILGMDLVSSSIFTAPGNLRGEKLDKKIQEFLSKGTNNNH